MPRAFMVTNRNYGNGAFGRYIADTSYYVTDVSSGKRLSPSSWKRLKANEFIDELVAEAEGYPMFFEEENEKQKHVSLFIHGYNTDWVDSVASCNALWDSLYAGSNSLGVLVLFSWPSNGNVAGYLPDREDARETAPQLAELFVTLHDYLFAKQRLAAKSQDPTKFCKAKVSVIAHSMGNFVAQNALAAAAKRLNSPQLVTLIHQLAMVAADVDNDIFQDYKPLDSDGSLMANLCYRISALYTGLDQVLGASAGLKHFGTRRLGRSGLADPAGVYDNVCEFDVSPLVKNQGNIHSAVFQSEKALQLLRGILIGKDRKVLLSKLF